MARNLNQNEPPDAKRSKDWAMEIAASVDCKDNLGRAIDLILAASARSDLPGPVSPDSEGLVEC